MATSASGFCSFYLCRHYFLKHLIDVVNSNAKRKRDANDSEKEIPRDEHDHRSDKVAGVSKRLKPETPSLDLTSGLCRFSYGNLYAQPNSNSRFATYLWDIDNALLSNSHPSWTESAAVQTWSTLSTCEEALLGTLPKALVRRN